MQFKGTVLVKEPGKTIPQDFLAHVMAANPSCMGAMSQFVDDENRPTLSTGINEELPSVEDVMRLQEQAIDSPMIMYFGKYPEGYDSTNIQPFELITGANGPIVALMSDGNFHEHGHAESKNSDDFFLAFEYFAPKLQQLYSACNLDVNKLKEQLKLPFVQKELNGIYTGRGDMILLFNDGEIMRFGQNALGRKLEWGYVSNSHDFKFPEAQAEVPAEPEKKGLLGSLLKGKKTSPTPMGSSSPATTVVHNQPAPSPEQKTMTSVPSVPVSREPIQVPATISSNSKIKEWYMKNAGFIPANWKSRPKVIPQLDGKDLGTLDQAIAASAATAPATPASVQEARDAKKAGHKTGEDAHIEQLQQQKAERKAPVLPALTPEVREEIQKLFLGQGQIMKAMDMSGEQVVDPKTIQAIESKYPSFVQQLGITGGIEATLNWPFESRVELCETYPKAAAILMKDMAMELRELKKSKATAAPAVEQQKPAQQQQKRERIAI